MFVGRWRGRGNPWQILWPRRRDSRFWHDLSRRDTGLSAVNSSHNGSSRTRVQHKGQSGNRHSGSAGWYRSSVLGIALLAPMALAGCRSSATTDPATTFQNIRSDFLHGNLVAAQQKAEEARRNY